MNGKALLAASCAVSLACGYIAGKAGDESYAGGYKTTQSSHRPHARENRCRDTGDSALLDSILGGRHGNSVFNILESVPADERVKLLEGIHQRMRNGRIRGISFDHLFATTLSYDATSAKEWLSKLPDEREKNGICLVTSLSLLEHGEKEAASQWLREAFAASPGKER